MATEITPFSAGGTGTAPSGTYLTTGSGKAIGQREDLSDVIERIDPSETPFWSNMNKTGCKAIQTDWQVQELVAPDSANEQNEGFDAAFAALKPTDRWNNVCQLLAKTGVVSDTLDAVDKAGRAEETAYQKILKGLEVRRDLETSLMAAKVRSLTDPRRFSAMQTWISNADVGATGAVPVGDGSNAGTVGTARALTDTLIVNAHQLAYEDGGKPSVMYMTTAMKRKFSSLNTAVQTGSAPFVATNVLTMTAAKDVTIVGSVGAYLTDFGMLDVIIDIFAPTAAILIIDKRHVDICNLPGRSFKSTDLSKTGSNKKFMVEWEGTLRVNAPKAHGAVKDINPAL